MAWVAPSTRTTGTLITASIWNQDITDNSIALRAGGIAIASQAALDFVYASSDSQLARLAKGSAYQVPRLNSAATGYEFAGQFLHLLKANSGTDTNAAATVIDTYALASQLTVKDSLLALVTLVSITQQTSAEFQIRNTTDDVSIAENTVAIPAGSACVSVVLITIGQAAATETHGLWLGSMAGTDINIQKDQTNTTALTGAVTVGLRHGGVTAGGTLQWRWALYRVVGQ